MKLSCTKQLRIYLTPEDARTAGFGDGERLRVTSDGRVLYIKRNQHGYKLVDRNGAYNLACSPSQIRNFPTAFYVGRSIPVDYEIASNGSLVIKLPPTQEAQEEKKTKSANPDIRAAWELFTDIAGKAKEDGLVLRIVESDTPSGYCLQVKDGWQTI